MLPITMGKYNEALQYFNKALELDPNYVKALAGKGYTLDRLKEYDEALKCYDKALKIEPQNAELWNYKD